MDDDFVEVVFALGVFVLLALALGLAEAVIIFLLGIALVGAVGLDERDFFALGTIVVINLDGVVVFFGVGLEEGRGVFLWVGLAVGVEAIFGEGLLALGEGAAVGGEEAVRVYRVAMTSVAVHTSRAATRGSPSGEPKQAAPPP
jgi:hypothetical protein